MEILIVFLPLLAAIISGFFGNKLGNRFSEILTSLFVSISAIFSIYIFYNVMINDYNSNIIISSWISSGTLEVNWSIKIDPLSSVMLVVVTFISSLVHIYSIGYMHHDPHKPRFMSYLSLFTFSMLMLVTSDNFLQLFFGWEGVGVCSYFLIGFWFKKQSANNAAIKAFLVNRVGDFGLALGIFLIFYYFGTINYTEVFNLIPTLVSEKINFLGFNFVVIDLICILLFIGAMGKSAQIFLHTWLPDAMEGPTPVSALIHAATMVTAGVGAYNVAMFHLFTHAFFKALLFLGAGSVIHSFQNEQDIKNMGGVWRKLPFTYLMMIIGTLALTGFPFLSGFYSKDAIIEFAYLEKGSLSNYAAAIGVITAIFTSIYSWRLIFLTFHGSFNNNKLNIKDLHESPLVMLIPLFLLSVGALFSGMFFKEIFIGAESSQLFWKDSIMFLEPLSKDHPPLWFLLLTPSFVIISIPFSYYLFLKKKLIIEQIVKINYPLYVFLKKKWYFDELYDFIFVKSFKNLGNFFWRKIDNLIIDRFGPDGISNIIKKFSLYAVKFQSGFIYQYAFIMLLGFSILLTFLIIK